MTELNRVIEAARQLSSAFHTVKDLNDLWPLLMELDVAVLDLDAKGK